MLNRRGFFATLAAVPLAALLPTTASAPVMACPVRRDEPLLSSCASDGDAFEAYYSRSYRLHCDVPSRLYVYTGIDSGKWVSLR